MKTLIVTVAGTATRFNRDTQEPTLKCLYCRDGFQNSLLYQILDRARDYDEYIIVGGYLFDKLRLTVESELTDIKDKIKLVYNPEFSTYGSGYSLILGLRNADPNTDEVLFVEGDLYFDRKSFERVKRSTLDVFTVNHELISARKAVVVYEDTGGRLHYLYDTKHSYLEIPKPFLAIYNSGQVWRFLDTRRIMQVIDGLTPEQMRGTNLEIIQGYFGVLDKGSYDMVEFNTWHNCNTVADYDLVYEHILRE